MTVYGMGWPGDGFRKRTGAAEKRPLWHHWGVAL